jgi:hypothetical protein
MNKNTSSKRLNKAINTKLAKKIDLINVENKI